MDPYHFDADPDADPILLITLMLIRIQFFFGADPDLFNADADLDPDPTFHLEADPDSDPIIQLKAQTLEKCSNRAQIAYILACHLKIDADPDPTFHFDADPGYQNYANPTLLTSVTFAANSEEALEQWRRKLAVDVYYICSQL